MRHATPVLYLARKLKEHTLLQAIARVNRLHEGKENGLILDYSGVEDLDEAIDFYVPTGGIRSISGNSQLSSTMSQTAADAFEPYGCFSPK